MTRLFPRIPDQAGISILESLNGVDAEGAEHHVQLRHPEQEFPPVGGNRVTDVELQALRGTVVELAGRFGFPSRRLSRTALFDREAARLLHHMMDISPHEASSRGMWTFVTCCLLVDIALWRFPGRTPNRFVGHINRNAFRRLWWRVEILGEPPQEDLPDPLWDLEDALVQLMERPGLSGNPDVARAIAEAFREVAGAVPKNQQQALMRDFQLRIMRRTAFMSLDLMNPADRDRLLASLASTAVDALAGTRKHGRREAQSQLAPRDEDASEEARESSTAESASEAGGSRTSVAIVDLDDVPLDDLPLIILETVAEEQPVPEDHLPELIAARGFVVPRARYRLLSSFAWYLAAKKALRRTSDNAWQTNKQLPVPAFCSLSINELAAEAASRRSNGGGELFDELISDVVKSSGRVPKPYARAVGAAIRKAGLK